jgi:hypothetical protein
LILFYGLLQQANPAVEIGHAWENQSAIADALCVEEAGG